MIQPKPNWVRDALNILTYRVYFSVIREQSSEIIYRLSRCREPEVDKLKLLALCNLPQDIMKTKKDYLMNREMYLDSLLSTTMKNKTIDRERVGSVINNLALDSLFTEISTRMENYDDTLGFILERIKRKQQEIPLWVNALLGDTVAEKKIILDLKRNNISTSSIMNASFVWSDACKKAFFALFEKDYPLCPPASYVTESGAIIDAGPSKYEICRSLQDSLLIYLARHHPDDPMFGNLLSSNRYNADFCKPEAQVPYFMEFAKWVKKHYDVEITYKSFIPYFKKDIWDAVL